MFFGEIKNLCNGTVISFTENEQIVTLLIDSRKLGLIKGTLFFAISGERNNGHDYLDHLYRLGVRNFIVEEKISTFHKDTNIIQVTSSIQALQSIASYHRSLFSIPVIGITGSNGKTIIKEWLSQCLSKKYSVIKSPGSYNSQIGVPLSVWQLSYSHEIGVFEAGISRPDEMGKLEKIIKPTVGIFTNIGTAHDEGFESRSQKIKEKLLLFNQCETIIYCNDHLPLAAIIESTFKNKNLLSWGTRTGSRLLINKISVNEFEFSYQGESFDIRFPFVDLASQENACHCIAVMAYLNISKDAIKDSISLLESLPMRLELKPAFNNCQLIDDTYNNDLGGLQVALNFLSGLSTKMKTVILSDILQTGLPENDLVETIAAMLLGAGVVRFYGIGSTLKKLGWRLQSKIEKCFFYDSVDEFMEAKPWLSFHNEVILIKGARVFQFEKITQQLQKKIHGTVLEINLGALVHNLNVIKSLLKPSVKVMAMVKAFAYGSGSEQIASLLQYHNVNYLGVAYADEGVELRKNNISLPIMVMNPTPESFALMTEYKLEPEVYSYNLLNHLISFLDGRSIKIHLKLDTGMHRLGFIEDDIDELIALLVQNKNLEIASIFSHLAGADQPEHDPFTLAQVSLFDKISSRLKKELSVDPLLHVLNSSGILRFPDFQFSMVRLGIGLYGVNPTEEMFDKLEPVATLKTIISQIKRIKKGETIGYGRHGVANIDLTIATIAIGYADGFTRALGKGAGKVLVNGMLAPVIGNVCMDMTMIDITDIHAKEGDEVIIFGKEHPIQKVAAYANTIPYEIFTNTSERVKRVFYTESI